MKHIISILSLVLLVAGCKTVETSMPAAEAEAPAMNSQAAAAKLLSVLKMDENFDAAMQQAIQMQSGMFDQMDMTEEEKAETQKSMQGAMKVSLEKFSWENMKGMFVDIYAEVFSAEELQGIIAFYESEAGQKFVEKQPQLMQVTMQKMQGVMAQMMPEIQKEMEKAMEEVQAAASDSEM
jgi:hypothetical protein